MSHVHSLWPQVMRSKIRSFPLPALGYFYTLTIEEESSLATVPILFVISGKGFQVISIIDAIVSFLNYFSCRERVHISGGEWQRGRGRERERERDRERERILSRFQVQCRGQYGARSQDPGIMIWAEKPNVQPIEPPRRPMDAIISDPPYLKSQGQSSWGPS